MKTASLTHFEKRIVKRLIIDGEKGQDVHHLVNIGRRPIVNFGRLSGAKDWEVDAATDKEIKRFRYEKSLTDQRTGLSPFENERIYRAREAMMAAVQLFNSPTIIFKVELFPVLSQIAWTYLLHEFFIRKGVPINDNQGNTLSLSTMISRPDCPLGSDVIKNLMAVKELRDRVEHRTLNSLGQNFWPLFQANCLNFDQTLRKLFGDNVGLNEALSTAIQFSKMDTSGLSALHKYDLSPDIEAIDNQISQAVGETGNESIAYKFKVSYTFEKATKGDSNIVFTDNNKSSKNVHNVLTKQVVGDDLWPYKAMQVVAKVAGSTGKPFNSHHHTLAWKKFGTRPRSKAKNPKDTNKEFCHYHAAHGDYTYSLKWVEHLIQIVEDDDKFEKLKTFKPKN